MPFLGSFDLYQSIQIIVVLLIAITIHELAHAVVADRLGDPTPRRSGELSLNPFVHMDQAGVVLLVLSSLAHFGFTYGRTHVTPTNLKFGPQKGNAIVAVVGPLSNLLLAFLLGVALALVTQGTLQLPGQVIDFLGFALRINVLLFVLNLLPIPPLDGFSVLGGFLTARQMYSLAPLQQWGPMLILVLFIFDPLHLLTGLLNPAMYQIQQVLCHGCLA